MRQSVSRSSRALPLSGRLFVGVPALVALVACSASSGAPVDSDTSAYSGGRCGSNGGERSCVNDARAHVVIADQYNNRVFEIDRAGDIVWTFGDGASTPGLTSVVGPNDAERLPDGNTLISGTGVPGGSPDGACTNSAGCSDNRVMIVNPAGRIVWQYGGADDAGAGPINTPVAAVVNANGNVLITDQANNRIVEVTRTIPAREVWQFPPVGTASDSPLALNSPNSAQRLANGNTLIADESGNRVIEVKRNAAGTIVWQYPATPDPTVLNAPAFASRLPNGHTLITDSNNAKIDEVDSDLHVVWTYSTTVAGPVASQPVRAVRLANGDTLITDQLLQTVIEIDSTQSVVFTYGQVGVSGTGTNQLNGPYDAKVVGDYTGLAVPPAW